MTKPLRPKKRIKHFIRDGIWASTCEGLAESNFTAFAASLSASAPQLSLLTALQSLVGCSLQLCQENLLAFFKSQKKLVLACVGGQILVLCLMLGVALFSPKLPLFLVLALLFSSLGGLSGPIWSTWISHLLPSRRKGLCFGMRHQRTYPANFLAVLIGSLILERMSRHYHQQSRGIFIAFSLVFFLGAIAKLFSLLNLSKQPEVHTDYPQKPFDPVGVMKNIFQDRRIQKASVFYASVGFAVSISGPFQTLYLLKSLHLSYLQVGAITASHVLARFIAAPKVGHWVDKYGSKNLLVLSSLFMPLLALGWCLSTQFLVILAVQFFAGWVWTVFDLCTFVLLTEITPSKDRHKAFSSKQIAWSLSSCFGSFVGGHLFSVFHWPVIIFWVSALMRLLAGLVAVRLSSGGSLQILRVPAQTDATV